MQEQNSTSTLTIEAGDTGAEQRQADIEKILRKVAQQTDVAAAKAAWDKADERLAHVRSRAVAVDVAVRSNNAAQAQARADFSDSLAGYDPLPTDASAIAALADLSGELIRASEQFAKDRIPRCEVRALLLQSDFMTLFSRELSDAASVRMSATIASLAPAILAEGGLTFDPKRTISGELQAQARQFLEVSQNLRDEATAILLKFNIQPNESSN